MSSDVILRLVVIFASLFTMLFAKFPVFICMGGALLVYSVVFPGAIPLTVFAQSMISGLSSQNYVAILFYFFLGEIMTNGGLGDRLISFLDAGIGHIRGSLSHINILSSMVFAGVSGSAVADTASVGSMNLNLMKKAGYPAGYAAAVTAISSIIGPIIPPSTGLVMLAVYFGASVRRFYIAGVVPGLLMGITQLVISSIEAKKRNFPYTPWRGWKYLLLRTKDGFLSFLLPALIMIFLFLGIGTVVEVGATSCIIAIILAIAYREITPKKLLKMLMRTTVLSATCTAMLCFSGLYMWVISSMGVATWIGSFINGLGLSPMLIGVICMIILFILGMILDVMVILMVIIPVMVPVVQAVGLNPVWFSVMALIVNQIGLNTPPVGTLIYMTSKISGATATEVIRELVPYIIALVVLCALMTVFPQIVTFLPNLVIG